ncbi:TniQ protein [Palleronia salina]|uniref:TniQ protein n=2 Tax=Palleronia salina TaxID=313368 RepID=A0A1M6KHB3_9RHOB|nr:TniQ protein [Palleronia salina]
MLSWTGVRVGNVRMRFRGELFVSRALRNPIVRGCPVCLREDALQHDGPNTAAMVMRGDWQLREVDLCVRHGHPLIPLWKEQAPRDRNDIKKRLEEIEGDILAGRLDQAEVAPSAYDLWLDDRLRDGRDGTWLKGQPLFAATTFIRLLGQALLPDVEPKGRRSDRESHAVGFDIARNGEATIRQALDRLAAAATGHLDEPRKAFGAMYSALSNDYLEEVGFDNFRRCLRECILDHWPVAPGEEFLGETVTERRLHSVVTAAREIGVGAQVVEHHLVSAGAIAESDRRPRSRKTFDAKAHDSLLRKIPNLVGSLTLRRAMGATRHEYECLVKEGILIPQTRMAKVKHPWDLTDGVGLVDKLQAKCSPVVSDKDVWETLLLARQRTGISLTMLIEAIRANQLKPARTGGVTGFHGILVSKSEVDSLLLAAGASDQADTPLPGVMSAAEFGRTVGLRNHRNFTALIEAGHTPAEKHINPKTGRPQYRVSADDIKAFHCRFVTLPVLSVETGHHRNTLRSLLAAAGVSRFSPAGQDFGPVFLRSHTEKALYSRKTPR